MKLFDNNKIAFIYSGQGSQYYQMGDLLYRNSTVFRGYMELLDKIAVSFGNYSVLEQLFNKTHKISESFDDIRYTHPAIFMIECSLTKLLIEKGIHPYCVCGTSLGEFSAMVASDMLSMEDGMHIIMEQAVNIHQKVKQDCGMMAILEGVEYYNQSNVLKSYTHLVADNYDKHFVVAGYSDELFLIEQIIKKDNKRCQILPIHYGFHSPLIEKAKAVIVNSYDGIIFYEPECIYISGIDGQRITSVPSDYIWNVIRSRMDIKACVCKLEDLGVDHYIDLGTGGTMGSFVRRNLSNSSGSKITSIVTPLSNEWDNLERLLDELL